MQERDLYKEVEMCSNSDTIASEAAYQVSSGGTCVLVQQLPTIYLQDLQKRNAQEDATAHKDTQGRV